MASKLGAVLIAIVFVLSAGCATQPSAEDYASADYGQPISQEQAQSVAISYLNHILKDPQSAQYQWGVVSKGWSKAGLVYGGATRFGYALQAMVNAKNSFGGYTGGEPYHFLFYNGQLVSVTHQTKDGLNEKLL